ncbi:MAG: SPW repeat protein [Burkholderiales bacterium]|nr:SPW repeat protein [Burkholderiales bacterium]
MAAPRHWQDPSSAVAGLAILVSPWLAGYAMVQPAVANAVIVGACLVVAAIAAAVIGRPWVECGIVGLGAWMLAAPFVLSFADAASIRVALGMGLLVLLLGAAALAAEWRARARTRATAPASAAR